MANYSKLTSIDLAFYRFANECFINKYDIAFKGGCLVRHILREANKVDIRGTEDIDFDASELAYLQLTEAYRDAMRFNKIRDGSKTNIRLIDDRIDCDVVIVPDIDFTISKTYDSQFGKFNGVCLESILADKISAMSGPYINRRGKDLCDIYVFSTFKGINVDVVVLQSLLTRKELGDFKTYKALDKELWEDIKKYNFDADIVTRTCTAFVFGLLRGETNWTGSMWI